MKEEKLYNQIEAYLAGEMSEADRLAMEQELTTDENLKTEVNKHKLSRQAIEVMIENSLRNSFSEWEAEGEAKVVGINRGAKIKTMYRRLAIAMGLILLIGFGLTWIMSGNYSNDSLYASHYEPLYDSTGDRGPKEELILLNKGLSAFVQKDFEQAIAFFEAIPENNPTSFKGKYYIGHVYLAMGENEKAIEAFKTALSGTDKTIYEKAQWNLILAKLRANQIDEELHGRLDTIIADEGHSFHDGAVKLKEDLDDVLRKIFH